MNPLGRTIAAVGSIAAATAMVTAVFSAPAMAAQMTSCGATANEVCHTNEIRSSASHKLRVVLDGGSPSSKAYYNVFDVNTQKSVAEGNMTGSKSFTISGLYGTYRGYISTKSGRVTISLTNEV